MESINKLIDNLVQKRNKKYCKMIFDGFGKNGAFIFNNYQKDKVDEDSLINLLKSSTKYKIIQWFIPDILSLTDESSITNRVFEQCLKYPGRYRKTLLIQLAHMWLRKDQLIELNQILETPEAFYKLFLMYLQDKDFSVNQLQEVMLKNVKHLNALTNYKEHLSGREVTQDKIILADKLIEEH